ncbi:pro-opiomelanocortin [Austrofundulus limnaeus]|uniref:Pro-opiomelanocortin n=1 Tax=Austrofundulus limnaeus TaxID=52670 RepID=A0A2I4D7M5_AUSLI|nr:PREDICTED: pro-opiomelanocortin-like [Austrofundulus limnaeus]
MVRLCWLFVMAFVCRPGFGSLCSVCNEFSRLDKILDCFHLCTSEVHSESPDLIESAQQTHDDDDDDRLSLSIILSILTSGDQTSGSAAHRDERRSYAMEHFRWGKPSGRKRRPVKVFISSLEGGASPGADLLFRARRHLSRNKAEGKGGVLKARYQTQGLSRPRARPSGLPEKKYKTYRMSHFRWGNPPASKRDERWEKNRQGQLTQFLQNILMKDV